MSIKNLVSFSLFALFVGILLSCSSETKGFKFTPGKLNFEDVYRGEAKSIDVVLRNNYNYAITISEIAFERTNDFSITANGTVPFDLAKNAEHAFTITFEPTANGEIDGIMKLTHSGSRKPDEFYMVGYGVPIPKISLSESNFDFEYRLVNTSIEHKFEITNIGTANLTIDSISLSGNGASEYIINTGNTTPVIIIPGMNHKFSVKFTPTTTGQFPCNVEIYHDGMIEAIPYIVALTGEAFNSAPIIELDHSSPIDFGSVAQTIPSVIPVEIHSNGLSDLNVTAINFATGLEFTLDHIENANGATVILPQTVQINSKITAFVKFTPSANSNFSDTMSITHDAIYTSSPLDIELKGGGRNEITKQFTFTGAAEQWIIPSNVSSIVVESYGAEGYQINGGTRGIGGMAKATIPVKEGETINIFVGGKSSNDDGGWNGGAYCPSSYGAGGGGASDIRIGGVELTDRVIVGGGGGGAGHNSGKGGDGGGLTGGDGTSGYNPYPGKGGTQTAGGLSTYSTCRPGTLGVGGRGSGNSAGGGGGGGGYYGGGGGFCSGGGGGSSFTDAPGNTDKSTATGVRSGNGEIIIKY